MIQELWAALKAHLLACGGHDRLIDFLEDALTFAKIERARERKKARQPLRLVQ